MEKILEIRNLYKSLSGRPIINNVSFDVYAGEVFGFIGPNGAGKTTTIKMVMGFLEEDSGQIIINGVDHKKDYEKAMSFVGGIVENPEMYDYLSGRKNIEMYASLHGNVTRERIDQVIRLVGMSEWANEKIKRYSLGMKQRIGLAQALVHKPKLLILDEPTNGLDPQGIMELRYILKRIAHEEGTAVVVSSHQLGEMEQLCDRVGIISYGRMLCVRTMEELRLMCGGDKYIVKALDLPKAAEVLMTLGKGHMIFACDENRMILGCTEQEIPSIVKELALADVSVTGLTKISASLEEAYLRILRGGVPA